jgi:hypothetical protein
LVLRLVLWLWLLVLWLVLVLWLLAPTIVATITISGLHFLHTARRPGKSKSIRSQ